MNKALVTGGAGFIGSNLTSHLLNEGWNVMILDSLCRAGTDRNLSWLKNQPNANKLDIRIKDIRDFEAVKDAVKNTDMIVHLAGQVAVTTSCQNPREDFDINANGALNILEAARSAGHKPVIIYASTNKVYGALDHLKTKKISKRYVFKDDMDGVDEKCLLDFHSPYGCSKGAADQYMRDYFRIYGIPTIVFRQSCIYGPLQMGMEDQGWVAHIAISALNGKTVTIYGDGRQVRDLLFVDDLVNAYMKAVNYIGKAAGKVYNIGGGKDNAVSLLEYIKHLEKVLGKKINTTYSAVRPGDQKIFIADNSKVTKDLKWRIKTPFNRGIIKLLSWIKKNKIAN